MLKDILLLILILLYTVWIFGVNYRLDKLEKNIERLKCDSARFIMPSFTVNGVDCTLDKDS